MTGDFDRFNSIAGGVLDRCALRPDEMLTLVIDSGTMPVLAAAFQAAALESGAPVRLLDAGKRRAAFEDLPASLLDQLLSPGLVVDLTGLPWLYSDSLTRYAAECKAAGSRLAMIWGDDNLRATLLASPIDQQLLDQATAATPLIAAANMMEIRSSLGTDFRVGMLQSASMIGSAPTQAGDISAPLYASVTAPFAKGSANGRLLFQGAGRLQGPDPTPFFTREPIEITIEKGYVISIDGSDEVAELLKTWRAAAPSPEVDRIMDCNLGFDPRGNLSEGDNMVVHCYAGGIMIGIGSPYEYRAEGSRKPGFHLDLLFTGCDVDLDGRPFLRVGTSV